jgi:hypothetical protein
VVDGIQHVYIETHNWGKSAAFWKALGYQLEEEHGQSGLFRPIGVGQPYIYLAEVPPEQPPRLQLYLHASEEFVPAPPVDASGAWSDSHWGTRLLPVRDPDGREHVLQVGAAE